MSVSDYSDTVTTMAFNRDNSLFTLSTTAYFAVYTCGEIVAERIVLERGLGGMKIVQPVFKSPLLVIVSSGDTPGTSPRRLKLWNMMTKSVVREKAFDGTISSCSANKETLVVGTEGNIFVFSLADMTVKYKIVAKRDANVVFCLSNDPISLLAYSIACVDAGAVVRMSSDSSRSDELDRDMTRPGEIAILDCTQLRVVSRIYAHKSSIVALAFSCSGHMLATASVTGSLVRVFSVPGGQCLHELRHSLPGSTRILSLFAFAASGSHEHGQRQGIGGCSISSLSFCPESAFLLCVSADAAGQRGGFVNVFHLNPGEPRPSSPFDDGASGGVSVVSMSAGVDKECAGGADDNKGDSKDINYDDWEDINEDFDSLPSLHSTARSNLKHNQTGTGTGREGIQQAVKEGEEDEVGGYSDTLQAWRFHLSSLANQSVEKVRSLSQEYFLAASATAGAQLGVGQAAALYVRIHNNAEVVGGLGRGEPQQRTSATVNTTTSNKNTNAAGSGSGGSGISAGVDAGGLGGGGGGGGGGGCCRPAKALGAGVPNFFAGLNYFGPAGSLSLTVISSDGAILRRYGLGFLQENKNKGAVAVGNERIETISLSDAQTPAAAREIVTAAAREGMIPHTPNRLSETHPLTLSEILEVEVPLLE